MKRSPHIQLSPRAEELLVERATRPLADNELRELDALGVADDDTFDAAAAAAAEAAVAPAEPLPAHLVERILAAAPRAVASSNVASASAIRTLPGVVPIPPARPSGPQAAEAAEVVPPADELAARRAGKPRRAVLPWLAAAACLLLAGGAVWWAAARPAGGEVVAVAPPTPAQARTALVASAPDVALLQWTATADAAARGAHGDVVWSQARQAGFMRFVGLAANDPKQTQYQLWIFDRTRDQAFPVDGGVFDVGAGGEVIVPISAKLHVDDATLFAVTVERPGGVVVSKRERIVVTAQRSPV